MVTVEPNGGGRAGCRFVRDSVAATEKFRPMFGRSQFEHYMVSWATAHRHCGPMVQCNDSRESRTPDK